MEVWKEVKSKGFCWLVSPTGKVKTPAHESICKRVWRGKQQTMVASFPERTLKPYKARNGYLEVAAMKGGRRVKHSLHRLIGLAFVDGYSEGLTINHIDGNKMNNRPENLEWVSLARNTQHEWETGLVNLRGERNPVSKLTSKRVVYIRRLLAQGIPAHALAIVSGLSPSLIAKIRDGERWPTVTSGKPVITR